MRKQALVLCLFSATAFADVGVTIVFKKEQTCLSAQQSLRASALLLDCKTPKVPRFAYAATYFGRASVTKALAQLAKKNEIESATVSRGRMLEASARRK